MSGIGKLFGGGQSQQAPLIIPPAPPPVPTPMPDVASATALEDARKKLAAQQTGGRDSTLLGGATAAGPSIGNLKYPGQLQNSPGLDYIKKTLGGQ